MGTRQTISDEMKLAVGTRCCNCGSTDDLSYHHVVPVVFGGNTIPSNMFCVCGKCHDLIHYGKRGNVSHSQLAREGIAKAKARGVKLGRKPADGEHAMEVIAAHSTSFEGGDWTEAEIKECLNLKQTAYCKYKRMLMTDLDAEHWNHSFPKPVLKRRYPLYNHYILSLRAEGKDVTLY